MLSRVSTVVTRTILAAGLGVVALLCGQVASANEGKPVPKEPTWGSGGGEVNGIADVAVVSERLELDFRPLESWQSPTVSATYELNNEGDAVHVPLVFASYRVGPATVELDGQGVSIEELTADELPRAWSTPNGPVASETAGRADASGFSFEVDLTPGEHTMAVRYELTGDFTEYNPAGHEVRYSFQPAVSWQSVGTVVVVVYCPQDWTCIPGPDEETRPSSNELDFVRAGSSLRAEHDGLPGALRLVLRRPAPLWLAAAYPATLLGALLLMIGAVIGGERFMARGQSTGRRFGRWIALVPTAFIGSCACSTTVYEASELTSSAPVRGYASFEMGVLGLFVAVVALGIVPIYAAFRRYRLNASVAP